MVEITDDDHAYTADRVRLMTPAFPQGDVILNDKNQALKILDTEYKMGEATELMDT